MTETKTYCLASSQHENQMIDVLFFDIDNVTSQPIILKLEKLPELNEIIKICDTDAIVTNIGYQSKGTIRWIGQYSKTLLIKRNLKLQ